ncbi:MAG: Nif3-like dinuclear metal center hexameric protein [Bacteroidetes bacterium]|nr:Nif3-like dinuclear metal center hexameric protein [Bacteroidota bacterium]
MRIQEIIAELEKIAPSSLQESYDNSGLIVGSPDTEVKSALLCLDSTEAVVEEAIAAGCGLIIAHHPIIFKGIKKLNGKNYVERAVIKAVQHNIAIYACHTNLDNVLHLGVNSKIAGKLGLKDTSVLKPLQTGLQKLVVFVPHAQAEAVLNALFAAGAGNIGQYSECSFSLEGSGTFKAGLNTNPYVGEKGERHFEKETRLEVILPSHLQHHVVTAMIDVHPYEEVAYDIYKLENSWSNTGSGIIGKLDGKMDSEAFLKHLKSTMGLEFLRYSGKAKNGIETVAICGGAGSFLTSAAIANRADVFITSDIKYHEFFDAEDRLLLCDIGHFESERFTIDLFAEIISKKFPNFATIFAKTLTNPVNYYF